VLQDSRRAHRAMRFRENESHQLSLSHPAVIQQHLTASPPPMAFQRLEVAPLVLREGRPPVLRDTHGAVSGVQWISTGRHE